MNKKILLPIMMAGPLAMPALADVTMSLPTDWIQSSITGDQNNWSLTDGKFECVVGTGTVEVKLDKLPAGDYSLAVSSYENATFKVDGTELAVEGGVINFTVKENYESTLAVEATNKAIGFSFQLGDLTLKFDNTRVANTLQNLRGEINVLLGSEVNPDDDFTDEVNAINATKAELEARVNSYNGTTESIKDVVTNIYNLKTDGAATADEVAEMLDMYAKYGLNNTPSDVLAYFENLKKDAEAYKQAVDDENAAWAIYLENKAAREALLVDQAASLTSAEALQQAITDWKVADDAVKQDLVDEAAALVAEIKAYADEINTAYPLDTNRAALREPITFESKADELNTKVNELQAKFDDRKADYEVYYQVNFTLLAKLQEAYDAYNTALDAAKGVEGYDDVYADVVAEGKAAATKLYTETRADNQIENVIGAVEVNNTKKCVENIQAAIDKLGSDTETFNNLVESQNEIMTEAQGVVADKRAEIKYDGVVPSKYTDEYARKQAAAKEAVDALEAYNDEHYRAHDLDLTDADYTAAVEAADEAIKELKDLIDLFAPINELQAKLDKAKADVKDMKSEFISLSDKFASTFENLQASINALNGDEEQSIIDGISDQIAAAVAEATEMNEMFVTAHDSISDFQADLKDLGDFVNEKKIDEVPAVQELKAKFGFAAFNATMDEYNRDFTAAAAAEKQKCWDLIKKLNETLGKSTLSKDMDDAKKAFAEAATDANLAYAQAQFEAVETLLDQAIADGVYGADKVDAAEITTALTTIEGDITVAKTGKAEYTALAKCDDKIEALLADIKALNADVNALIDNQKAYDDFVADRNDLLTSLDEVKQYNEKESLTPGKEYFADEVIAGLETKLDNLQTALDESLKAISVVKDGEGEDGFKATIQALEDEIKATRQAITVNNQNHDGQLAREKEVRTFIETVKAQINENENAKDLQIIKEWLQQLDDLLSNDHGTPNLADVNIKVTQAYGKGESAAKNAELMAAYDEIYNLAKAIQDGYQGEPFHDAVVSANQGTTEGWTGEMTDLNDDYRGAVREYNYFFYDLTNKGWKTEVLDNIIRHQDIFKYFGQINELNSDFQAQLEEWNKENHVITAEEYKEWTDKAGVIAASIDTDEAAMMAHMDQLATSYYAKLHGQAETALSDAEAALAAAGIDNSCLDKAKGYMTLAETAHTNATAEGQHLSKAMNGIADNLDLVLSSIDLQKFAEDAWNTKFNDAKEQIAELRDGIVNMKGAESDVKAAWLTNFDEINGTVTELGDRVSKVTEGLIDDYKDYAETLDTLLAELQKCYDEVKKNADLNTENEQIKADFDAVLPDLNSALAELRAYASSMGGCIDMMQHINSLDAEIKALAAFVESHDGDLVGQNIDGQVQDIILKIANGYTSSAVMEMSYLRNTLGKMVKVAFNDAVVNNGTLPAPDTFDTVDAQITEILSTIDLMQAEGTMDFRDEAVKYEQELCKLYVMLQGSWTQGNPDSTPAADLIAGLNERYQAIADAIAAGQTELDKCLPAVQEEFADAYTDLKGELDGQQTGWQAEGDNIISRAGYYDMALDDIEARLEALNEEIQAKQDAAQAELEKQQANQDRYDALKAQYDSLVEEFEEARTMVDGYSDRIQSDYENYETYIQQLLDEALAQLDAEYKAVSLTDESQLKNARDIENLIYNYKFFATRAHAAECLDKTQTVDGKVADALRTHIVPQQRPELEAKYAELHNELQDMLDKLYSSSFEELQAMATRADELAGEFDALLGSIQEATFTPGDLNDAPDGEVNVTDVQILIDWVGERKTLADLTPVQAAAADLNGDGVLNVSDITALINLVLDGPADDQTQRRAPRLLMRGINEGGGSLSTVYMETNDGVRRYAISLSNAMEFVSGQLDIVATGEIVDVTLGDRAMGHDLYTFDNGSSTRVILASMANEAINGTEGELLYIDVRGTLEVTGAVFSDVNANAYSTELMKPTFIDSIMESARDTKDAIYNVAGQAVRSIQRGINIIRHSDGTTTKEYKK